MGHLRNGKRSIYWGVSHMDMSPCVCPQRQWERWKVGQKHVNQGEQPLYNSCFTGMLLHLLLFDRVSIMFYKNSKITLQLTL